MLMVINANCIASDHQKTGKCCKLQCKFEILTDFDHQIDVKFSSQVTLQRCVTFSTLF